MRRFRTIVREKKWLSSEFFGGMLSVAYGIYCILEKVVRMPGSDISEGESPLLFWLFSVGFIVVGLIIIVVAILGIRNYFDR